MKKFLFFIAMWALVILNVPVFAQLGDLGINPLLIDGGSRPLGMGGAFAGIDDLNSSLYNPGGLAWAKGVSLSVKDPENISALQAFPTGYGSSLGLAVVTTKISDIPIQTGLAHSASNVVYVSFGSKLSFLPALYRNPVFQRIGLGLNIKGLMGQTLRRTGELDKSAYGWEMDLGVLWKGEEWWSAGASLQNILPERTWGGGIINWNTGEAEALPTVLKIAGSAQLIGDIYSPIYVEGRELLLSGEMDLAPQSTLMRLGGEWNFFKRFFLRAGFMQQNQAAGVVSDITFGLGLRSDDWGLDFASYREPIRNERSTLLSFLYFPKEWIVIKKLEVKKPAVKIIEPIETISLADNIIVYDDKMDVFGKVKPNVDVYINGLPVAMDSDHGFKTAVPLNLGKNFVVVEARFEGEKKTWKYKVLRKAKVEIAKTEKVKKEIKENVEALVTMGVIEITPDKDFVMEAGITRGELASWIVKAAEVELPKVQDDLFKDIPKEHMLAPYIKVVTDLKIMRPFADGTFKPEAVVSKAEGDAIFKRFGVK